MGAQADPRDWTWATRPAAGRSPVREWASLISTEIAEMAITSEVEPQFSARWTRYGLSALELNFLSCSPQVVLRSPEMVARGALPNFELLFVRSGPMDYRHGGESGVAPPGSFVLLDDQQDYRLGFPKGSDCLTVRMPQVWLQEWVAAADGLVGRTLGVRSPWGRPLAGLLTAIADAGLGQGVQPRAVLADQIGGMVAMLAGEVRADAIPTARGIERRAQDVINALHADPSLDPARVAAELSISVRHLHRMLARSGDSFSRRLNIARIAAAESLLASREGQGMPIGEIAWRVGFADQSHFARLFRAAHGCAPSAYRAERQG